MTRPEQDRTGTVGVVLAAGPGTRFGLPKALVTWPSGRTWAAVTAGLLRDGGCAEAIVVTGARAEEVRRSLPPGVRAVHAAQWAAGLSASVRAGLTAAAAVPGTGRVVLVPVDTPGLTAGAVRRVLDAAGESPSALARAAYDGRPGHPVVLGVEHLRPALASLHGDRGARGYLDARGAQAVECGDIASGADVDTEAQWRSGHWREPEERS